MTSTACLLTVHGIGFQQPPTASQPGYADALHERLREVLGDQLGDDPEREGGGPVYVSSAIGGSRSLGLARLAADRPLSQPGTIAHVAVVYSPSEPLQPSPGPTTDTLIRAALNLRHYDGLVRWLRLIGGDAVASLFGRRKSQPPPPVGLQPRTDAAVTSDKRQQSMLRALEDDIATYVYRNDLRERVRGFIEDILLALIARSDTGPLSINAHSQGTVVALDVLGRLPFTQWKAENDPRAQRLAAINTAGSPIRKYVDLFSWGADVGQLEAVLDEVQWRNFWDAHDPIGDPLSPPVSWRPGTVLPSTSAARLLHGTEGDSGASIAVAIEDVLVDNLEHSGVGLMRAHNYWANQPQFIRPLAESLRSLAKPPSQNPRITVRGNEGTA